MHKLDHLDKTLISILRSDARTPVVKLAKQLNVSRATIQNRMQALGKPRHYFKLHGQPEK